MYTHPETGERVTGPNTFTTKADATRWLSTVEADLHRGDDLDPAGRSMRFGVYARGWLKTKTELRPTTVELYEYLLERHVLPALGDAPIGRITAATVREWNSSIRSGRISDTTAAKAYRLLRQIMQAAVDDRLIRENPCRIKGASVAHSRERRIPTLDEVSLLADAIDPRYRAMVLIAAFAGLRKGECFGLARRHLDLDADPPTVAIERSKVHTDSGGMIVQDPKTTAGVRTLALPAALVDELRSHLDRFVHSDADCPRCSPPNALATPPPRSCGAVRGPLPARRPACRARFMICAMWRARSTPPPVPPIKEAMARLGHASPVAALRYQHAVAARDAEIAGSVDKLIRPGD